MEISVSIIIPTFNGAKRICHCLDALLPQIAGRNAEIIVVNDGSMDNIAEVVARYPGVRLITQANAGPAAARNRGAQYAGGELLLFTDDDCVPTPGWLNAMIKPFEEAEVVGVKGAYRSLQRPLVARFVQAEYEDRYRLMAGTRDIDFVDTYSAGYRRARFLEMNGYDMDFPVACAEDIELSYRMSAKGWKMRFVPEAIVYHQHPDSFRWYLKKKFKFAFWRVLAVRKNPRKAVRDSHTPQLMKLQLLFGPAMVIALILDLIFHPALPLSAAVAFGFLLTTIPFAIRCATKDPALGAISPFLLAARSCSQLLGVLSGVIGAREFSRGR